MPEPQRPPAQPPHAWPFRTVALMSGAVAALAGTVGWAWAELTVEVGCADHFSCGDLRCPPCASRLHWALAGAAGQGIILLIVGLLILAARRHPGQLRLMTLLTAGLTPLAIIWYLATTAATSW